MKQVIGALSALKGYCERKDMKLSKVKAHVDNIGFLELSAPCFAHARGLTVAADNSRTFSAMADAIQAVITEIERVIDAAHDEARQINRLIGNLDCLPECAKAYGFDAEAVNFIIALNRRLHPELVKSDIRHAHNIAWRMEICMGHLFEDGESAFMTACNDYGFSAETVQYMRGVVSRMLAKDNAALARCCTALRLAIKQSSLSRVCALMNGDLTYAARMLGMTITTVNGTHYHDLQDARRVNLLQNALAMGFKSDVLEALNELRADAHA